MRKSKYIRGEWYKGEEFEISLTEDVPALATLQKIEKEIGSLRPLYEEYVLVNLQNEAEKTPEKPVFFKVMRDMTFYGNYAYCVELGMASDEFSYTKQGLSLDDAIELFRTCCVKRVMPGGWELSKESRNSELRRAETEEQCDYGENFLAYYWQGKFRHIENKPQLDFAESEALEAIFTSGYEDAYYTAELARIYEELGLYKKLDKLFETHSDNPVIAQIKGEMAYHGIFGKPDYKAAFKYFTHAMKIGSVLAQYYLAKMYRYGQYVRLNYSKYVSMIRSAYSIYQRSIPEGCPYKISLELSKIEQQFGNDEQAIKYCLDALELSHFLIGYGHTDDIKECDEKMILQLYSLVDFDPDDMDLFDLLYVLRKPHRVNIYLDDKRITVQSYYNQDRLVVKCGDSYYANAIQFLNKHKENGKTIISRIDDIDYMEIDDE